MTHRQERPSMTARWRVAKARFLEYTPSDPQVGRYIELISFCLRRTGDRSGLDDLILQSQEFERNANTPRERRLAYFGFYTRLLQYGLERATAPIIEHAAIAALLEMCGKAIRSIFL